MNRAHVWFSISKGLSFQFCGRCGLINLKNSVTRKAMNKPCPGRETEDGK